MYTQKIASQKYLCRKDPGSFQKHSLPVNLHFRITGEFHKAQWRTHELQQFRRQEQKSDISSRTHAGAMFKKKGKGVRFSKLVISETSNV